MSVENNGPDNIVLRYLREIDRKLDLLIDRVDELTKRVNLLEHGVATLNGRIDRIDTHLEELRGLS